MIGLAWWQGILNGLGWLLAKLYDFIPNYGVAIILLTILIRLLLLPLGMKQVRSMQAMQSLQPRMKAIQQKYKGNKQKQTEEIQRLYQEAGVNPLAGCLPMLLQLPVLIALYSVLRFPANVGAYPVDTAKSAIPQSHIPVQSRLYDDILTHSGGTHFLGTNLLCSAGQAGTTVKLEDTHHHVYVNPANPQETLKSLDCGHGIPVRIPYYLFAILMVGTTYFQQRQMQRASPGGQQQQALTRIMPLLFGVWGFLFPAGLVVYWTTSNLWQIGQQAVMLRAGHVRQPGDGKVPAKPRKKGMFLSLMERAQSEQERRRTGSPDGSPSKGTAKTPDSKAAGKPGTGTSGRSSDASQKPRSGKPQSSGAKSASSRKKRRKR